MTAGTSNKALIAQAIATLQAGELPISANTDGAESTLSNSSSARTLRSLLADPALLVEPLSVIPHLAVTGRVTLLSGREKVGKSTLVATVVAAASRGDTVLGVPVGSPVETLWYAVDEPLADTVRRFDRLGVDPDRIVINTAPRTMTELLAALELDLAAFRGARVVVIDTLSRILAASGVDPNSCREVEPVIMRVVDFFHRHDIAGILLYHTGKGGKEYRGSTAIGATVDDILTLRRRCQADEDDFDDEGADDGQRVLDKIGRNLRGRLRLTCVGGVYRLHDATESVRDRVSDVLGERHDVRNRTELARLVGGRKAEALNVINEMIAEGVIIDTDTQLELATAPVPIATVQP